MGGGTARPTCPTESTRRSRCAQSTSLSAVWKVWISVIVCWLRIRFLCRLVLSACVLTLLSCDSLCFLISIAYCIMFPLLCSYMYTIYVLSFIGAYTLDIIIFGDISQRIMESAARFQFQDSLCQHSSRANNVAHSNKCMHRHVWSHHVNLV